MAHVDYKIKRIDKSDYLADLNGNLPRDYNGTRVNYPGGSVVNTSTRLNVIPLSNNVRNIYMTNKYSYTVIGEDVDYIYFITWGNSGGGGYFEFKKALIFSDGVDIEKNHIIISKHNLTFDGSSIEGGRMYDLYISVDYLENGKANIRVQSGKGSDDLEPVDINIPVDVVLTKKYLGTMRDYSIGGGVYLLATQPIYTWVEDTSTGVDIDPSRADNKIHLGDDILLTTSMLPTTIQAINTIEFGGENILTDKSIIEQKEIPVDLSIKNNITVSLIEEEEKDEEKISLFRRIRNFFKK